ncbi:hypothetical protein EG68_06355 [Paragonimus skrjabini miyazakii]|uniref:GOST seven transmembrane domain-containing protein n=1 Tax=Paragonimus skrjabini miyazakii TaxID=59628 RepID=A0A8S9YNV5_9TREM|nr:hypothetical protein EG68_06355 [Paragonimus skrjabini miyazakii]
MGCCPAAFSTMLLILGVVVCFPEDSFLKSHVSKTRLLQNVQLSMADSDKISFKKGSSHIKCSSLHPYFVEGSNETYYLRDAKSVKRSRSPSSSPGLLTTVWESGAHLLVLKVDCLKEECSMDVDVEIELRNPDGSYLSAVEFPFLPFNGVISLLYLILVVVWLVFIVRYWHNLMRIQCCIGVVLVLGLWEHLTLMAIYETVRKSGQVAPSATYFAELIACVKRTLARLLVLIACLGYGVTKPRLSAIWFRRCLALGLVYFILVTIEGMTRVSQPRFTTTYFRLATLLPLLCLDVGIMWWIFIYLARTLRETRMRHNLIKHKLYRNFSYVLLGVSLVSLVFMIWSVGVFKQRPCIESWRYLWIDDAFWQFLFVVILAVIIVLWRPTGFNREYAYSLLDSRTEEPGDMEEEEDVLLDRLDEQGSDLNKVRSRLLEEVDIPRNQLSPGTKQTLSVTPGTIPATIVERLGIEASSGPGEQTPVWKID